MYLLTHAEESSPLSLSEPISHFLDSKLSDHKARPSFDGIAKDKTSTHSMSIYAYQTTGTALR